MKLKIPPRLRELFEELKVFTPNKKSFASKVFALSRLHDKSTYRATASKMKAFLEPVSKSAVWY